MGVVSAAACESASFAPAIAVVINAGNEFFFHEVKVMIYAFLFMETGRLGVTYGAITIILLVRYQSGKSNEYLLA